MLPILISLVTPTSLTCVSFSGWRLDVRLMFCWFCFRLFLLLVTGMADKLPCRNMYHCVFVITILICTKCPNWQIKMRHEVKHRLISYQLKTSQNMFKKWYRNRLNRYRKLEPFRINFTTTSKRRREANQSFLLFVRSIRISFWRCT